MIEAIEFHEFGFVTVEVRITYTDHEGMYAEPLSYEFDGTRYPIGTGGRADEMIKSEIRSHSDERHLECILADHPAFESAPYDELPVSQSEFQDMRI